MPSTHRFAEFVADQVAHLGEISVRRMFGEFFVYINARPVILICDDTCYVRVFEELRDVMGAADTAQPFSGAKQWYILDIDDAELVDAVVDISLPLVPVPTKKTTRKNPKGTTDAHPM